LDQTNSHYLQAGSVRINGIAQLETVVNLFANYVEIFFTVWGIYSIVCALREKQSGKSKWRGVAKGAAILFVGLATPGLLNFLVAAGRDNGWFN